MAVVSKPALKNNMVHDYIDNINNIVHDDIDNINNMVHGDIDNINLNSFFLSWKLLFLGVGSLVGLVGWSGRLAG